MNISSVIILVLLFALAGLAVWRNIKKGAPCSCGCSCKDCACCGHAAGAADVSADFSRRGQSDK